MQYVCLIYQGSTPLPDTDEWSALSEDEQQAVYADYAALNAMPNVTQGLPLGLTENARTVRVEEGAVAVTEGPFVNDHGAIGGYFIVEAEDVDDAVAVAVRVPAARHGGAVEVRPAETYW